MQQDVVLRVAGVVLCVAARPVVADRVRIDGAVAIEGAAGDGLAALQHRLQPLLAVLVPEVERPVRPRRHKCAVPARDQCKALSDYAETSQLCTHFLKLHLASSVKTQDFSYSYAPAMVCKSMYRCARKFCHRDDFINRPMWQGVSTCGQSRLEIRVQTGAHWGWKAMELTA